MTSISQPLSPPFYLAEDLEPWQKTRHYKPDLSLGTWPERREMGPRLTEKNFPGKPG